MKKKIGTVLKLLTVAMMFMTLFACGKKVAANEEVEAITEAFRTVTIATLKGTATVKHKDGQSVQAYEGMALYDGDDVIVDSNSNLIIDADSDKHLLAEGGSHFWLTIDGTDDCTKTKINLEAGAVLCQIEEKLGDDETFDVSTASSTMCVRGTVFRVNAVKALNNEVYDVVEVYDGKVWSHINDAEVEEIEAGNDDGQVVLEPGQCAMIKEATETSGAAYITADQIDKNSWESEDFSIVVDNTKEATGSPVLDIAYNKLPSVVVDQLAAIADGGTELSVGKEDLQKLSSSAVEREANAAEVDVHQALIVPGVIIEEDRHRSTLNDSICAEYGHTIILINGVKQCTICGLRFNDGYHETEKDKANHDAFVEEAGFDSMNIVIPGKSDGGSTVETKTYGVKVSETTESESETGEDKGDNGSKESSGNNGPSQTEHSLPFEDVVQTPPNTSTEETTQNGGSNESSSASTTVTVGGGMLTPRNN